MAKTTPPSTLRSVGARVPSFGHRSLGEGVPCTPAALRRLADRAGRGVTVFWPIGTDSWQCCRRVTLTEPYRRAVSGNLNLF